MRLSAVVGVLMAAPLVACGTDSPGASAACDYEVGGTAAKPVERPPADPPTSGTVTYELVTTEGKVAITMDRSATPCTVNSFGSLAEQGYFDGTSCHRLADSGIFVLQCGDPTGTGSGGPGYTFADETTGDESYVAGTVAMANAGPDTNGSQFFLVWNETRLPPNYTVFGRMDEASRGVVTAIAREGHDGSNPDGTGKPNNPARILRVEQK